MNLKYNEAINKNHKSHKKSNNKKKSTTIKNLSEEDKIVNNMLENQLITQSVIIEDKPLSY
jgi:hypothetical protein